MTTFTNQKVVVTGASRGLGRAISLAFLSAGAQVIGIYGSNSDAARDFAEECKQFGDRLQLHQCDVSDSKQVEKFFRQVEEEFDTIDVLINNAGIRRDGLMALMDSKDWQQVIDINLTGTFNMSKQAVLLMMKEKYGRIINITSPVAHLGFAGQANYAASKAGQIGMTKSLAKETARKKITVNCVSPGFIATDLLNDLSAEQVAAYKKLVPMRRFGTAKEVAYAVLFLAGPQASYITGTVLEVNGGL
ncbi:MAG: 3-oxoacyl-[acyl-carrier-protein] reductase [Proteobacteria bacterium]|jgi:3-oxoacyl-[acyl-carrier protein] reductase|nr:3-oxoacyl-[acyl-carrier-protein] reductase [Desulfocapsa sp.]MBU3944225.1 3-oxoacyl-[acyl-carrier-protein] reductase [Pseudomonadota bacterium]MCG2743796.1 3-oxoacyl-[acyl-carrier-protein] reductase [Desulfobacteraceae bacterium]MBU3982115.1 3-oxoacyl-[acyl-carrier-protein] reductase [Pseudomonadota bacterium]MBU4028826.1 3-oxoacyl-[acyl-carrier-protein] reductase [Pseudomonadota bacterium]